LLKHRGHTEA